MVTKRSSSRSTKHYDREWKRRVDRIHGAREGQYQFVLGKVWLNPFITPKENEMTNDNVPGCI